MSRHALLNFPWGSQVGSSAGHAEFQVEAETDEDLILEIEKVLERYYLQFFKGKPQEVQYCICEDGEPVGLTRIGDKYDVKISITMMLVPKKPGGRKAKRNDDGE